MESKQQFTSEAEEKYCGELIDREIGKMYGSLEAASIKHFLESGTISGSFRLRLISMLQFYKWYLEKNLSQPGPRWVRCWEQKPDTHKVRFKDKHGNEFIGNYSKDTGQYWAYGLGQAINDVIYWRPQDESAAGREDAVEFAEWLNSNFVSIENKEGEAVYVEYSPQEYDKKQQFKIGALYELFKQQKEK